MHHAAPAGRTGEYQPAVSLQVLLLEQAGGDRVIVEALHDLHSNLAGILCGCVALQVVTNDQIHLQIQDTT